jgi:hypothetical protein
MLLSVKLALATMFAEGALSPGPRCSPLHEQVVRSHVESVLLAHDFSGQADSLNALHAYWRTVCADARREANETIIDELARLLKLPIARLTIASMLVEVGPKLPRAEAAVTAAAVDQERIDRETAIAAEPAIPTTDRIVSMSLKCVERKIGTGDRDEELCQYLLD